MCKYVNNIKPIHTKDDKYNDKVLKKRPNHITALVLSSHHN